MARFLIRCVFAVWLLKDDPFTVAMRKVLVEEPVAFECAVERRGSPGDSDSCGAAVGKSSSGCPRQLWRAEPKALG